MTLANGTTLGQYEVSSLIGEGGMGEVYRARDKALGRDVAIKVLPGTFSADPNRLKRFEQEAQAAGSLNHPNILVIYHVGTSDGAPYIVSELLEGESLRERINGVSLPQRKAIDYALQIAHGLAAAHEKGIVHRDLKPENLFVTKDGRIKILDFGLAKLTQPDGNNVIQSDIPTRRVDTDPGTVMGTIGYMSPEQVRGRPVDHRADIFSFGAILYEMLSGKRAFHGESTADTMSAILREDPPDLSATNKNVAPALERVINHCLEKNPEERFHSANDLAFAIEALSGSTSISGTAVPADLPSRRFRTRELAGWVAAAILLAACALLAFLYFRTSTVAARPLSFVIGLPEKASEIASPIISPDGNVIAFVAAAEGKRAIYVRYLESTEAKRLDGTDDAYDPFWSHDSRFIGFFSNGKLKKVAAAGGPPQTLCDAPAGRGGAWNSDGVIVFGMIEKGLHRVSAAGGEPTLVIPLDATANEVDHSFPRFLPDGQHILFWAWYGDQASSQICVASLDGKSRKSLFHNTANVDYVEPGYILFARDSTLMAQHFDVQKLEFDGDPFPVMENVMFSGGQDYANFSVSQNGTFVFWKGSTVGRQLGWFDRTGKQIALVAAPAEYNDVVLSPDGKRAATQRLDGGNSDIWIVDLERSLPVRFTFGQGSDDNPSWSADGAYLYYTTSESGKTTVCRKTSGGAGGEARIVSDLAAVDDGINVSPDGRNLIFELVDPKTASDLWVLPLGGDGKIFPLLNSEFDEQLARFSPDGDWLAYVSTESGRPEVYVRNFPATGSQWQVSTDGGGQPHWRRDGKELYFITPDRKLMAVDIKLGTTFVMGTPQTLFQTQVSGFMAPNRYDTLDGQRFLINSVAQDTSPTPITVIVNWAATLKR